jgi:hypothetical protein
LGLFNDRRIDHPAAHRVGNWVVEERRILLDDDPQSEQTFLICGVDFDRVNPFPFVIGGLQGDRLQNFRAGSQLRELTLA